MSLALYQGLGGTEFRASDSVPTGSLFDTLEPAQMRLLDFIRVVANYELGPSWSKVTSGSVLEGTSPVQSVLGWRPHPALLRQANMGFPLLALFPVSGDAADLDGDGLVGVKTIWILQYTLPPLAPEHYTRVGAVLNAVQKLVRLLLANRYHLAYDNGLSQFETGKIAFASVAPTKYEIGLAKFADSESGESFPTLELMLETTEIQTWLDGECSDFDGLDIHEGMVGPGGTIPNAINGTDQC